MRGLLIFLLVGLVGCSSPKYLSHKISGSDISSKTKVLGEFSSKDYHDAKKALQMVSHFAPDLVFTNSPKLSWIDSDKFAGLTIMNGVREIFVDKEFKIKKGDNLEYFKLALIIGHEMLHFERSMDESEVQGAMDSRFFLIYQNQYQKILNYKWK